MVIPLIACAMICSYGQCRPRTRKLAFWGFLTSAVLMLLTSNAANLIGPDGRIYALLLDSPFWATPMLVIGIVSSGPVDRQLQIPAERDGLLTVPAKSVSAHMRLQA